MMKILSTTETRKHISNLVTHIRETGTMVAIGRRGRPEVLMMRYPLEYNNTFSDITNISTYSRSFDFLAEEPELYTLDDLIDK